MLTSKEQIIKTAIRQRSVLKLKYDNDVFDREFEPYVLYEATTGNILLAGIQIKNPMKVFDPSG